MLRRGFTLVELLASIAVMAAVGGMLVYALNGARADARHSRAEAQIKNLTEMLLQRYEEEAERRFPAVKPDVLPAGIYAVRAAEEASRVRLMLIREYLRCALPDRRTDLLLPPASLQVRIQTPGGAYAYKACDMSLHTQAQARYLGRLEQLTGTTLESGSLQDKLATFASGSNAGWSQEHESAECLYLILSSSSVDGIPMIESLRPSEIADTDGDGVPEIVDPWGTPVAWMRWPVGFHLTYADRADIGTAAMATKMSNRAAALGDDELDYMKSDWGFKLTTGGNWSNGSRQAADNPFTCLPLVVSAGADGQFDLLLYPNYLTMSDLGRAAEDGIYVDPVGSNNAVKCQDSGAITANNYKAGYGKMSWTPPTGFPSGATYYYPDPFCRNTNYGGALSFNYNYATDLQGMYNPIAFNRLLGSFFDANADGEDNSVDNIYGLSP